MATSNPRLIGPQIPAMVSSPVWQYGGHRISFCFPELQIATGCPDYSVCIPPGFTMIQWSGRDIAKLPDVLAHLQSMGVTNVRVVIGLDEGVVTGVKDLQNMLDPHFP